MADPSTRNVTLATATLSFAVAVIDTELETVALAAGAVRVTVGGVVSMTFCTLMLVAVVVAELPALSTARAWTLCVPLGTEREFQDKVYGGARSVPTALPSTRNVTLATPDPSTLSV